MSNRGLDIPLSAFSEHFEEDHVAHSNALHGIARDGSGPYLVGPIARYNNNFDQLSDSAKSLARECGLGETCSNPFQSIIVRMIEVFYACEEALRLATAYEELEVPAVEPTLRKGAGYGCTEAPRGICFHHYRLDEAGYITHAQIVPPTSQNQPQIECDLRGVIQDNLNLDEPALTWRCEQTIRNYDPCISCATHFLKLTVVRD